MKCGICKKDGFKPYGFKNHLRTHNILSKDYYLKYINSDNKCHNKDCYKNTKFISITEGYGKYCSRKCANSSEIHKEAVSKRFEDNLEKKLNADYKRIKTTKERHGEDFYKNHFRKMFIDQGGTQWRSERTKKQWESYSTEEYSKVCSNIIKGQTKSKTWYKDYYLNEKVVKVQGYEPQILDFIKTKINESDIIVGTGNVPVIIYQSDNKCHNHYPDIFIEKYNLLIEVKSEWTFDSNKKINLLKQQYAKKQGFNYIFAIYSDRTKKSRKTSLELFEKELDLVISSEASKS